MTRLEELGKFDAIFAEAVEQSISVLAAHGAPSREASIHVAKLMAEYREQRRKLTDWLHEVSHAR